MQTKNENMTPEELEYNGDMNAKYPSMTKKQLIAIAKEYGLSKGISKWRKQEIIDMLKIYATPYNPFEDDYAIDNVSEKEEKSVVKDTPKKSAGSIKKTNKKISIDSNNIMKYIFKHFGDTFSFINHKDYKLLSNDERSKGNRVVYQLWKGGIWFKTQNWNRGQNSNPKTRPSIIARVCRDRFEPNGILIKRISQKGHFYSYTTIDRYIELISDMKNSKACMYEVLDSKMKRKPYVDLDGKTDQLEPVLNELKKVFKDGEFCISARCGDNECLLTRKKKSYHIVVSNYYFSDLDGSFGFKKYLEQLNDKLGLEKGDIDTDGVFKSNQLWGSVNQYKDPKKDLRMMIQIEPVNKADNHLVLNVEEDATCADDLFTEYDIEKPVNIKEFCKKVETNGKVPSLRLDKDTYEGISYVNRKQPIIDMKNDSNIKLLSHISPEGLSYSVYFMIAMWCKKEGLTYDNFYDWCSDYYGYNQDEYDKWEEEWCKIERMTNINITREHILVILEKQYGKIVNYKLQEFISTFLRLDNHDIPTKVIKKDRDPQYIRRGDYNYGDYKYHFFNTGMGSGKTFSTIQEILEVEDVSVLWITNRRSLKNDVKGNTIKQSLFFDDYEDPDIKKYPRDYCRKCKKQKKKLICEIESLYKFSGVQWDYVIMDEIDSLLMCFLQSTTFGGNSKSVDNRMDNYMRSFKAFCNSLNRANQVFMMDAFLTTRTRDFVYDVESMFRHCLTNEYTKKDDTYKDGLINMVQQENMNIQGRTIKYYKDKRVKGGQGFYKWYDSLVRDLKDGKKCYVFYPHRIGKGGILKMGIEDLALRLSVECGIDMDDIVRHYGGSSSNNDLTNVNELWGNAKLILTNSCISVGVSYEREDVDMIYICAETFINPRDLIQTSARIRNPKCKDIQFTSLISLSTCVDGINKNDITDIIMKPSALLKGQDAYLNEVNNNKYIRDKKEYDYYNNILTNLYKGLLLEYDNKTEECLRLWWDIAQIYSSGVIYGSKNGSNQYKEFFKKHKEELKCGLFDYDIIEPITREQQQIIRAKVNNNLATGMEQLQLQRYYNDVSFRPVYTDTIVETMCGMNIWEKRREFKNEKKFWFKGQLLQGFRELIQPPKLLRIALDIDTDALYEINRGRYVDYDVNDILKLKTTKITELEKRHISNQIYSNIEKTDDKIRLDILQYYFGKGYKKGMYKNKKTQNLLYIDRKIPFTDNFIRGFNNFFTNCIRVPMKYSIKASIINNFIKRKMYKHKYPTFGKCVIIDDDDNDDLDGLVLKIPEKPLTMTLTNGEVIVLKKLY